MAPPKKVYVKPLTVCERLQPFFPKIVISKTAAQSQVIDKAVRANVDASNFRPIQMLSVLSSLLKAVHLARFNIFGIWLQKNSV